MGSYISENSGESGIGGMNSLGACLEESFLLVVEVELDNLLDTVAAKQAGNAYADVTFAIFTFYECRAGDYSLLVMEHCCYYGCRCCTGCIPC